MSATLEYQNDNAYLLRGGGVLKESEVEAAQSEFVQHIVAAGPVKLLVLLESFTRWERGAAWDDTESFFGQATTSRRSLSGNPRLGADVLAFTGAGLRKGPVKLFPETGDSAARTCLAE